MKLTGWTLGCGQLQGRWPTCCCDLGQVGFLNIFPEMMLWRGPFVRLLLWLWLLLLLLLLYGDNDNEA